MFARNVADRIYGNRGIIARGGVWSVSAPVISAPLDNVELRRNDRVGGGVTPAVLPHHRTYGSVYGGS